MRGYNDSFLLVGETEVGEALTEGFAAFGFLLQFGEGSTFLGEGGGGFAELDVGLVDEGLFCLEL